MTTASETRAEMAFIKSQGYSVVETFTDKPRATWWTPSGREMPNLPNDSASRALYRRKGFLLKPPDVPAPTPLPTGVDARLTQTGVDEDAAPPVAKPPGWHRNHRFNAQRIGSSCIIEGCTAKRTKRHVVHTGQRKAKK